MFEKFSFIKGEEISRLKEKAEIHENFNKENFNKVFNDIISLIGYIESLERRIIKLERRTK